VPECYEPEVYRTVLQGMHMGVYLIDPDWRIRFWNEGAERITGHLSQDVIGHLGIVAGAN